MVVFLIEIEGCAGSLFRALFAAVAYLVRSYNSKIPGRKKKKFPGVCMPTARLLSCWKPPPVCRHRPNCKKRQQQEDPLLRRAFIMRAGDSLRHASSSCSLRYSATRRRRPRSSCSRRWIGSSCTHPWTGSSCSRRSTGSSYIRREILPGLLLVARLLGMKTKEDVVQPALASRENLR